MSEADWSGVWFALSQGWDTLLSSHPVVITLLAGGCLLWLFTRRG